MKHHSTDRPIGKCKGCCLNLRTVCAAGIAPKAEWSGRRCRFRDRRDLLAEYLNPDPPTGAKAAKLARRKRATTAATTPHYDGQLYVAARIGGAVNGRR